MGDGMAIWTEWNEVLFRIDHVVAPQLADRHDVMDLDIPVRVRVVCSSEVHAAGKAGTTVYRKRSSSFAPVPFVAVYLNYLDGTPPIHMPFLRDPGGRRVMVLVNDFGAINIDAGLIENADSDTIALTNGCACCSIGNDLFEAARAAAAGVGALAPARCLTVVNGRTVREISDDRYVGAMFRAQIRVADDIFVNRTTPVEDAWLQARFSGMKRIAAFADLLQKADPGNGRARQSAETAVPDLLHRSQIIRLPEALRPEALTAWITALPPEVERVKGFVMLIDGSGGVETRYLSYARGSFELTKADKARVSDCGTLTVIAREGTSQHMPLPRLS